MYLRYGNHRHDVGECELSITAQGEQTGTGGTWATRYNIAIAGQLQGASAAEIEAKARLLEDAYSIDNQDFALMHSTGGATHLAFSAVNSIGGVRVIQRPSYPSQRDASYVTFLNYVIALEVLVAETAGTVLSSFEERISIRGGGPRWGVLETKFGEPIRQPLRNRTTCHASQSGRAVGLYGYPTNYVPAPLWPSALVESPGSREFMSPRRIGDGAGRTFVEYPVSWAYEFASTTLLFGRPNVWRV